MTTAELDIYDPPQAGLAVASAAITERDVVDGWVQVVTKVAKLADMIADTDFVPKALRNKPAAITACMLTGREIGVGPMLSMKVIHMVNGTPSLAAEYKRARAFDRGHEIVYEETSITRCVVRGRRRGERTWATVTWTIEDAKRAKLAAKDVWQQNPRRMLEARATGELCDLKFPDCSWGLATTEALQDGDTGEHDGPPADQPAIEAPAAPAQRTARRRTAADKPAEPGPTAAAPAGATAPTAGPATGQSAPSGLPPLPGEEDPTSAPTAETQDAGPAKPGTDEPDDSDELMVQALADYTIELARHADHKWKKVGRCVYCDCGQRLYQGDLMNAKERAELLKLLDEHGTSTRGKGGQLTALWTVLSEVFGFTSNDKAAARKAVEHIIGRDLAGDTTGDLSYSEARTVLDTLANWQKIAESRGEQPMDVLVAVMAGGPADG
jgi:hypothetical protein